MKLKLIGHDERYTVEQSLMNLLPGELPVYEEITPEDDTWGIVTLTEGNECRVEAELCLKGRVAKAVNAAPLSGSEYEKEGQRRHIMARAFYQAACELTGAQPPWGMLTGVRPDKLVTKALAEGKTAQEARCLLERDYFVTPERASLALETGAMALRAARKLEKNDIAIYIGIPFCPTRCAYCSL